VLHKIVDAQGHDAGYLSFVEAMVEHALPANLALHFGYEATSIDHEGAAGDLITLRFANGASEAARVVLNVPQRPLLRLLSRSPTLFTPQTPWPAPLTYGNAYPIVKVYVHYDDAWWRNDLNLTAGTFNNSAAWRSTTPSIFTQEDCLAAQQTPFPLQGSYHDGDVRCDGEAARPCRGFLQAAYMGDPQAVRLYEEFHLSGNDSAVVLDPSRPDHRYALDGVHNALINLHKPQLSKVPGALARVMAMRPSAAVISAWSMRAAGIEAGCHYPRDGPPLMDKRSIAKHALAPLVGGAIESKLFVVNEAFGTLECWAEGSLTMAENAAHRLGLGRPEWMPIDVYDKVLFDNDAPEGDQAQRQAEQNGERRIYVSDLRMMEEAAKASA